MIEQLTFEEFAKRYCERQQQTVEGLRSVLQAQIIKYESEGFMLLECQMMDSSLLGSLTILGYGGKHTHKTIPQHPLSPRGLASDMSVVVATIYTDQVKGDLYEVVVSNIGIVYQGDSIRNANSVYDEYVKQSQSGKGRAGDEFVDMYCNGDVIKSHTPPDIEESLNA